MFGRSDSNYWGRRNNFGSWTVVIFLDKKWEAVCGVCNVFFFVVVDFSSQSCSYLRWMRGWCWICLPPLFQDCWCFYEEERPGFWSLNDLKNKLKARFRGLIQFGLYLLDNSL
jgi:hypothetical protein